MNIDLENKIILVTGATGGIGEAISRQLAEAGANVAVHYRSDEKTAIDLAKACGNRSMAFFADLDKPDSIENLFTEVIKTYCHLDVLVNNAGVFEYSPLDSAIDDWLCKWNHTLQVNLTAAGHLSRLAINHFKERDGGRIIMIASRAAFRGDTADYLAYAASKGGMVALSRSIARAFGKQNIKSFVIAPGFVKTRMADEFINLHGEESVLKEIALNELTLPDDIAPTVVLMASGLMDHATGCSIDINAASYVW